MTRNVAKAAPKGDGAPEIEIEVTHQMIDAGIERLGDLYDASLAYQAREVFLAMWAARRNS